MDLVSLLVFRQKRCRRYALPPQSKRKLEPEFAEFGIQRGLELLEVACGRAIALLFRSKAESSHLIEIPGG